MSETPVSDRDSMWSQRRPGSGGIYHRRAVVPKSRAHSQAVVFDRIWNAAQRGGREEQENAEKQHGRRSQGLRFGKRNLLWLLNAGSGDRCCCHAVREVGGNAALDGKEGQENAQHPAEEDSGARVFRIFCLGNRHLVSAYLKPGSRS